MAVEVKECLEERFWACAALGDIAKTRVLHTVWFWWYARNA